MTGGRVHEDDINHIAHYKENPLVQKAISDIKEKLAARIKAREQTTEEVGKAYFEVRKENY